MSQPENILIIRPSALGDVCRTVPVLASLRRAYPAARIDWLVQDSFVDAVWHHPGLTAAVPFPRRDLGRSLKTGRLASVWRWVASLRGKRYDLVLDCQGLARSGLLTWATGARIRAGYSDAREMGWLGLNRRLDAPGTLHTVDRMLALVQGLGIEPVRDMRLYTGPHERTWAERQARLWAGAEQGRGYIVLAPTSRWPGKRWPAERFASVARELSRVATVVCVGGAGEREQCAALFAGGDGCAGVIDLIGQTSVAQLMALVQGAALVLANDSAALHMAVGFDRPSIGLFGPTRINRVGPYTGHGPRHPSLVIQHAESGDRLDHKDEAAGRKLMERITTEEVLEAALGLLRTRPDVTLAGPGAAGLPPAGR